MPRKYALIIGIENYSKPSSLIKVHYAINDAQVMADYALQAGFHLMAGKPLLDEDASYRKVMDHLRAIFYHAEPEDFIFIYYAGHGYFGEDGGYLIPFDFEYRDVDKIDESCCLSFDSIDKRFNNKKIKRFLLFLDTCHSGFATKQIDIRKTSCGTSNISPKAKKKMKKQMEDMLRKNEKSPNVGRVIFTSSGPSEESRARPELKHGIFTYFLIEGLKEDKEKHIINVGKLVPNVTESIFEYCLKNNLKQTPNAYIFIQGKFLIPAYKKRNKENQPPNGLRLIQILLKYKKKIMIVIFLILIVLSTILITDRIKVLVELKKRDKQAYEKALSIDSIDAYKNYTKLFPDGIYISTTRERLEELKAMPAEVKKINTSPIAKVRKNKQGYWEAYYKKYNITMVYIPQGKFTMGQTKKDKEWLIKIAGQKNYTTYYKNETPEHDVFLDGYWLGESEISNEQYVKFLNDTAIDHKNGCKGNQCIDTKQEYRYSHIMGSKGNYYVETGYETHPLTDVSWYGAEEYCKWLSKKTGFNFKLPTEAQWEKAACWSDAEKHSFMFPWGDNEPDKTLANFNSEKTIPVISYYDGASSYGLLNMAGNVWEWCRDWYDDTYYSKSPGTNPIGLKNGKYRIRRGGGWNSMAKSLRCASRGKDAPLKRYSNVGFRICQE